MSTPVLLTRPPPNDGDTVWAGAPSQLSSAVVTCASTTNTLVAAVTAQIIRVYRIFITVAAASNLTFKSGSTAITGALTFGGPGSLVLDFDGEPWLVTASGAALVLGMSTGVQVSGRIFYTQG